MKKVILRGELGKKFGRVHNFDLNTPAEAIRALSANFEGFQRELCEAGERGIGYMVQIGRDAMGSLDEIEYPTGQSEAISITPVLQGAGGGGVGQIFAGIALVAAAIVLGPVGAVIGGVGASVIGAGAATAIGYVGAALILGGTSQLLSPTISDSPGTFGATSPTRARARDSFTPENNEIADNRASYIFNGAVNLTAQGNPVPILYGRMRVGSVVVSAGLSVEDI
nr:phage tail assembly protein [uncultured Mediterranean phage uvMED]